MIRTILPSLLLVAVATLAQEPAPAPDDATAAGTSAEEVPADAAQAEEVTERAEPASAPQQAPEDYRPSEEISEDLSVSFPVDI